MPEEEKKTVTSNELLNNVDDLEVTSNKEEKEEKPKKKKKWKGSILATVLLTVGYYMLCLPTILDQIAKVGQSITISSYDSIVAELTEEEKDAIFAECDEYNRSIAEEQKSKLFYYHGSSESDDWYESLPLKQTSQIGYIQIDKIDVRLPISHGTSDAILQYQVGHLYKSSLPTGGESTHAVLSGHSGLQTAKIFTDLEKLEVKDTFDIYVLGRVHRYEIIERRVVYPEQAEQYLQVQEGKDLITLYTCTPYGKNTHRLLLTGERIADPDIEVKPAIFSFSPQMWKAIGILAGLILVPPALLLIIGIKRKKEKEEEKKKDETDEQSIQIKTSEKEGEEQ